MRLIDADELIKGRVENDPVVIAAKCAPTAYDPDKIVEQLEDNCNNNEKYCLENRENCGLYTHCDECAFKSAIKIVKGGGV